MQVFSFWEALDNYFLFAFSALFIIVPCKQDHHSTSQSAKMPPNLGSIGLGSGGGKGGDASRLVTAGKLLLCSFWAKKG